MTPVNASNWFELYVSDFDRAHTFYQRALDVEMPIVDVPTSRLAVFPGGENGGVRGAISAMAGMHPGTGGTRVYLNVEGKLDAVLDRIPNAGGMILQPRTSIGPNGFIAVIKDSEGNSVGLSSMS
jgi:predicted enzyme related to lactoylglutathione lyase